MWVRDAGAVEQTPFLGADRALVADRERGEDAARRRLAQHLLEAVTDRFTHDFDLVWN